LDGGIERLGDDVNGFLVEETFANAAGILPWLDEAIAHFYPNSTYARSLHDEVRALAAQRLFQPPKTGSVSDGELRGTPRAASRHGGNDPVHLRLLRSKCQHRATEDS
jgi:hypothetical protein